ncbi:MAG: hypothetical protein NTV54_10420 [Ignavibacteriales bacterium]|nr:hypothetical protein [Ignavibacteriales bacterium]
MLKTLLEAYGIDYAQWKTLTRTSLRLASRQSSLQFRSSGTRTKDSKAPFVLSLVLYLVLGVVLIGMITQIPSPFWSSLVVYTTISFFIGSLMLTEFGSHIIAPEDYAIFSVQPVSSKTYFAAKSSFALFFVLLYTLALGLPSVITYGVIAPAGRGVLCAFAALTGLLMTGIGAAMSMILIYTLVLQKVHYRKLKQMLSYVQLGMTFFIYGSYTLLPSLVESIRLAIPVSKPWWVYCLPPSWYSMLMELAGGSVSPEVIAGSCAGIVFFIAILPAAFSKISLSYAESLAAAATVPDEKNAPAQHAGRLIGLLKRHEDRIVVALIRGQFRNDTKFRMGILAIVPLTLMYAYLGLHGNRKLFDPFAPDWHTLGGSIALYIAIILFPMMLKEAVTRSESFAAAWIFFATPTEKARLVIAVKTILFWFFIVPYLLLLSLLFLYSFRNLMHVLMHLAMLLLFSRGYLQILLLLKPNIPFSLPKNINERATLFGTVVVLGPIILIGGLFGISYFVYSNIVAYLITLVVFGVILAGAEKLLVVRISHKLATLEYQG